MELHLMRGKRDAQEPPQLFTLTVQDIAPISEIGFQDSQGPVSRPCDARLLQTSGAPPKDCPPPQALIQQFYSKMNQHGGSSEDLLLRQLLREERPPEQVIPHQLYWLMQNEPAAPPSVAPEQDALPNSILLDCCQHQRHEDGFAQEGDTQKSCRLPQGHSHLPKNEKLAQQAVTKQVRFLEQQQADVFISNESFGTHADFLGEIYREALEASTSQPRALQTSFWRKSETPPIMNPHDPIIEQRDPIFQQLHGHLEGESPVPEKFLPYENPDKCLDDPLKGGSPFRTSFNILAADTAIQQTPNHQYHASPMLTDTPQQHSFGAGMVQIAAQQSFVGWGSKLAEDVIHMRHQQFKLRQQPDGALMQRRLMRQRATVQAPAQHSHDTAMENSHEGWNLNLAQGNLREIQRLQRLALRQADSVLIQRRILRGRLMRQREIGDAQSLQQAELPNPPTQQAFVSKVVPLLHDSTMEQREYD